MVSSDLFGPILASGGGGGSGTTYTASNVGGGYGWFKQILNNEIQFKTLLIGTKLSVTNSADNISLDVIENQININNLSGTISQKSLLPSSVIYNDQNNNFGSFYLDIGPLGATPTNPPTGYVRLFVRAVDVNNKGLFILIEKSGGFVEMQLA